MTPMALIRRLLEGITENTPPPPSPLRPLPTAKGKPPRRTMAGRLYPQGIPPRPRTPSALKARRAQARALTKPRRPHLTRPELHRHHWHHHPSPTIAAAWSYVHELEPTPITPILTAAPFDKWTVEASMPSIEHRIGEHQWTKQWRANDIRVGLGLEPRERWEGEGR